MFTALRKKYFSALRPFLLWYLSKPRSYRHGHLRLTIYPSVFHPRYFFSTQILCKLLERMELQGKSFCEVGAGSGLISFLAFQKQASVTALDLNPVAVKGLQENLKRNFSAASGFEIYHSDLFDKVPPRKYDLLMINPPWYFHAVKDDASLAWHCGREGEYFIKLFSQLPHYLQPLGEAWMILAENAEVERIRSLAAMQGWRLHLVEEVKVKWEKNYIFKLINS